MKNHIYGGVVVLAGALASAGCGSAGDQAAAQGAAAAKPAPAKVNDEAVRLASTMVAAVSASKSAGAVDMRFELPAKPEVGKPLPISVAVIPLQDLEKLFVRFQAPDGVDVVQGAQTEQFTKPERGAPIAHTVTVVPRRDGIFAVTATVLSDSETDSVARSYSIPLIAGAGLTQ